MALQGVLTSAGMHIGLGFADAFLGPVKRSITHAANTDTPNLLPPISMLISSYLRGYMSLEQFEICMACQGAAGKTQQGEEPFNDFQGEASAWYESISAMQTFLGIPELYRAYNLGKMNEDDFDIELVRLGILDKRYHELIKAQRREPFPLSTLLQLYNRGLIPLATVESDLKERGTVDPDEIKAAIELGKYVPGPADIVRFMVRDVEDEDVVTAGQLDEDFADKFNGQLEQWANDQGVTVAAMRRYWRAHWQYPSAHQLYQMLHRLRPENIGKYQALVPGVKSVDIGTVIDALKVDDNAPGFVKQLAAISYSVPSKIDIRRMYKRKVVTKQDLSPMFQDLGYDPTSANRLAKVTIADVKQDDLGGFIGVSKANIAKSFELGAIDYGKAVALLKQHGLTQQEADLFMTNEQVTEQLDFVKEVVAGVKRLYLTGQVEWKDAQAKLAKAGVNQTKIDRLYAIWELLKISKYKTLSASQALDLFKRGLLNYVQVDSRLSNLGYTSPDRVLLLQKAIQEVAIAQQKALVAAAKSLAAKQRAQQQAIREMERQQAKMRADLARHGSPSQIARWASEGMISHESAIQRLTQLGWPIADAELLIADKAGFGKRPKATGSEVPKGS